MVWSPLAGGLLSGKYAPGASSSAEGRRVKFDFPPVDEARGQACIAALREVAAKHDTSVASVALAWILAKPFVMSVIIGAKNMEQLDQNIASAEMNQTGIASGREQEGPYVKDYVGAVSLTKKENKNHKNIEDEP